MNSFVPERTPSAYAILNVSFSSFGKILVCAVFPHLYNPEAWLAQCPWLQVLLWVPLSFLHGTLSMLVNQAVWLQQFSSICCCFKCVSYCAIVIRYLAETREEGSILVHKVHSSQFRGYSSSWWERHDMDSLRQLVTSSYQQTTQAGSRWTITHKA